MASKLRHIRSSTANKRPTASGLADGQLSINTASGTPGVYFKDSNGGIVKVGPVHIGATAPNATPAGSAGNSLGEQWLDSAGGGYRAKYWDGTAWRSPIITNDDIGASAAIALSKLATGALPSGITVNSANISDLSIVNADISASAAIALSKLATGALPSGITVNSSNISDLSIVDADISASAAVALSKLATGALPSGITVSSSNIVDGTIVNADINSSAAIDLSKLATGALPSGITVASANIVNGSIVDADVNASAAIAGTKISPNFGSQNIITTGTNTSASFVPTSSGIPTNGMYLPAANTVGIATNSSDKVRVDSNGDVLIGTTNSITAVTFPARVQSNAFYSYSASLFSNDTAAPNFFFLKSRNATTGSHTVVQADDSLGRIQYAGSDGTSFISAALISAAVDGTPGSSDMPGRLIFSTTADGASSPTERMRITSGGGVLVNTTTSDPVGSSVSQSAAFGPGASAGAFNYYNASATCMKLGRGTNGSLIDFFRNQPAATTVGSITVTTTATAYNTSSDYRLKENIVDLDGAIDRLKQLPVHRFNFIADPGVVVDGFIAHEAAQVVPEAVTGKKDEVDKDGNPVYQGIDQSKLVPLLTAALQEAIGRIEALEQQLARQ